MKQVATTIKQHWDDVLRKGYSALLMLAAVLFSLILAPCSIFT